MFSFGVIATDKTELTEALTLRNGDSMNPLTSGQIAQLADLSDALPGDGQLSMSVSGNTGDAGVIALSVGLSRTQPAVEPDPLP